MFVWLFGNRAGGYCREDTDAMREGVVWCSTARGMGRFEVSVGVGCCQGSLLFFKTMYGCVGGMVTGSGTSSEKFSRFH